MTFAMRSKLLLSLSFGTQNQASLTRLKGTRRLTMMLPLSVSLPPCRTRSVEGPWSTVNGILQFPLPETLYFVVVFFASPMEQRCRSSCEVSRLHALNCNLPQCLRQPECLFPRSIIDSTACCVESTTKLVHKCERWGNCELVRVEFHQILFRIRVNRMSTHGSDSLWSDPTVTWSKPLLLMPGVAVVHQFCGLILPRYHHVGPRHAKVVRPCRRIL